MLLLKENGPISCLSTKLGEHAYGHICLHTHMHAHIYAYLYIYAQMLLQIKQKIAGYMALTFLPL